MYSFNRDLDIRVLRMWLEGTPSCVDIARSHEIEYSGPRKIWYKKIRHENGEPEYIMGDGS